MNNPPRPSLARFKGLLAVCCGALLLGLAPTGHSLAETLNCPCEVVNVLTGDTVFVLDQYRSSRKVWLAGVDAPDMNREIGLKSRQHLIDLVARQRVQVHFDKRDRYGRIIGKLLKNGEDMNLLQIKNGFGRILDKHISELSSDDLRRYREAQQYAKDRELGLWTSMGDE